MNVLRSIKTQCFRYTLLGGMLVSCKTAYNPPDVANPGSYLVVEGTINTGSTDSTIFKLSHTVKLSTSTTTAMETGARMSIEDQAGTTYGLTEISAGVYAAPALNLPATGTYRLDIVRSNGSTYRSDYVQAKSAPPVDSVNYQPRPDGLHVFVNTHDGSNQTRYYRWDYSETYEFTSFYYSGFYYDGQSVIQRPPNLDIYTCFKSGRSTGIAVNSTAQLSKDVVSHQEVNYLPASSQKITDIYSIVINQYALTPAAFEFWQSLKRNTEQLGSIFDAQPSQLAGNIHNLSNMAEPVIGYVSAGTISKSKRVYFLRSSLGTNYWIPDNPNDCNLDGFVTGDFKTNFSYPNPLYIPLYVDVRPVEGVLTKGYVSVPPVCADCTLTGPKIKPSFWAY